MTSVAEHGTRSRYVRGCRCDDCREANRTYARRRDVYGWSERVAADWCDAEPARLHVQALQAQGMGYKRVAAQAGLSVSVLHALLWGKHGHPAKRMLRRNADAILAVTFDAADGAIADPTGTVRRIRALQAIGWPLREIGERIGIATSNLGTIACGYRAVTHATARKVAQVYDELSMSPGPSRRSITMARSRGWLPPLAWDDDVIDDPGAWADLGADPEVMENVPNLDEVAIERLIAGDLRWDALTKHERIEAARRMDAAGIPRNRIADVTRLNSATLWAAFSSDDEGSVAS